MVLFQTENGSLQTEKGFPANGKGFLANRQGYYCKLKKVCKWKSGLGKQKKLFYRKRNMVLLQTEIDFLARFELKWD